MKITILIVILVIIAFVLLKVIVMYKTELTEKISKFMKYKMESMFFNDLIRSLYLSYLPFSLYYQPYQYQTYTNGPSKPKSKKLNLY